MENTETTEKKGVRRGGGVSNPTHPPPTYNEETILPPTTKAIEVLKRNAGAAEARGGAIVAGESVQVFGVREVNVTMIDDAKPKGVKPELYDVLKAEDFKKKLPHYLARNEDRGESLIVRPVGSHLIQVDDIDVAMVERLKPFSFIVVETSIGNFQAWLALPLGTEKSVRDGVRSRLLGIIQTADHGASGALRWPGSINHKPGRGKFRVCIVHSARGRFVTAEELDRAGLLAPRVPPPSSSALPSRGRTSLAWPDYRRCVAEAPRNEKGEPNLSLADKNWCILALGRGWSEAEVLTHLCGLREKARRRPDYARRTVAYASRVVAGA